MAEQRECDHKWTHLSTHYQHEPCGYQTTYTRMDIFICERCCEMKEIIKRESARETPLWWMH